MTPSKILYSMAFLDKQVTNIGTEIAARSLGIPNLTGSFMQGFQVASDIGQRSAQFMGHIDHQAAAQTLDFLQTLGHPIKGPGQLADFIPAADRYPFREITSCDIA